ncbi:hypothetical protein [Embleya sp. NBC_00896]|uniref:hypothetical protein n=1 Tax=Embleya sp. NBC_00896 TaxID=2975961 RepID=UPI003862F93F|nr:hypothetical protein OG928_22290 [Embleya sp. NBC_00896]
MSREACHAREGPSIRLAEYPLLLRGEEGDAVGACVAGPRLPWVPEALVAVVGSLVAYKPAGLL